MGHTKKKYEKKERKKDGKVERKKERKKERRYEKKSYNLICFQHKQHFSQLWKSKATPVCHPPAAPTPTAALPTTLLPAPVKTDTSELRPTVDPNV